MMYTSIVRETKIAALTTMPTLSQAEKLSLFCFAWSPLGPHDLEMLAEARFQLAKCDGHLIFSDHSVEGETDIIEVSVPKQSLLRSDNKWLYHRNMVGLLPSWSYLIGQKVLEKYDWVLNLELDHFMSPARVRLTIIEYLDILRNGSRKEKISAEGGLMLMFGNAFLFNGKMVQELGKQWGMLGQTNTATSDADAGCPKWMEGHHEYPQYCSQDIVYPTISEVMEGTVASYGSPGCGVADKTSDKGKLFPLACWEMNGDFWNSFGQKEAEQKAAIRELAIAQSMESQDEVKKHYELIGGKLSSQWYHFYLSRQVPIIHHITFPSVLRLARQLLIP